MTTERITEQELRAYYAFRGMKFPDTERQAMQFFVTEVGEAMDAYIRTYENGWTRNNPDKQPNLLWELGDCYQMWCVAMTLQPADFAREAEKVRFVEKIKPDHDRIPFELFGSLFNEHNSHRNQYLYLARAIFHASEGKVTLDQALREKWASKGFVYGEVAS